MLKLDGAVFWGTMKMSGTTIDQHATGLRPTALAGGRLSRSPATLGRYSDPDGLVTVEAAVHKRGKTWAFK
jgi:hypothetical protein